ncbi:hypothetical protein CHLNCDRAFT_137906 [Chlorella variabilis]|uniref:C2 domain-containing protein n=1 Tax=Chlorella variabilis TaxID=554065 RepID=E1Z4T4_CHLVA|nr:hypothetical protein CHLNCDRAFT_137906 [Chlorella variabilis]EFN59404.1 hypothetical protein CHLNCDRAFT_137906 [Chlorella variabilis]|eukprot:XP_005851506.1 hypothetical protein CHLNCDRAFT_137906 [Chlorella variabilis]
MEESTSRASLVNLASFELGLSREGSGASSAAAEVLAAPEHGFDVLVRVIQCTNLPGHDWWNGRSDPYVIIRTTTPGEGGELQYKTRTVFRDLNPRYDEFFEMGNVPEASCLSVEVWDKDLLTQDDVMGRASWVFVPQQWVQQGQQKSLAGKVPLQLQLHHPRKPGKFKGQIQLEVRYRPSMFPGTPRLLGPVRFTQCFSPNAGFLMMRWNDDQTMAFCVWKLFLCHIEEVFEGVSHEWNRKHDKAARIYKNPVMLQGVRSQHAALYSTHLGRARCGVLCSAVEFFAAFNFGKRAGQRRYYTYSLMPDSLRCSETGAGFFVDFSSKHAMHANAAEEVLYAGEFCIVPDAAAEGGHRLVVDNNSGTFAPKAEHLPLMQHLFEANFPGMSVETVAAGDPRLEEYHRQCPSRLSPAAAAAAAAAAATETGAAEGTAEDSVGAEAAKLEKLALEQNGADSAP